MKKFDIYKIKENKEINLFKYIIVLSDEYSNKFKDKIQVLTYDSDNNIIGDLLIIDKNILDKKTKECSKNLKERCKLKIKWSFMGV